MFEQPKFSILQTVDVPRYGVYNAIIIAVDLKIQGESTRNSEPTHWQYDVYFTSEDEKKRESFSEWYLEATKQENEEEYCQCEENPRVGKKCFKCGKLKYVGHYPFLFT